MKSLTFCLLTLLACTVFGCKNNADNKTPEQPKTQSLTIQKSLVLKELADADMKRYDSFSRMVFRDSVPLKYYTVRSSDLMAAMAIRDTACKYQYVRVNLALDSNYKFKLYVQPVMDAYISADNPDKNTGGIGYFFNEKGDIINGGDESIKFLADLNAPCPNTCGR